MGKREIRVGDVLIDTDDNEHMRILDIQQRGKLFYVKVDIFKNFNHIARRRKDKAIQTWEWYDLLPEEEWIFAETTIVNDILNKYEEA